MNKVLNEMRMMFESTSNKDIEMVLNVLKEHENCTIVGLGAGRMGYSLRAMMMRLSHIGFKTYMIGDTSVPRIDRNSLVIINSSSGETPTNILYAQQAYEASSEILTFTCNLESSIAKKSDNLFKIPTIKSEQLMKSVYEQYTMLMFDYICDEYVTKYGLNISTIEHNHSILE